MYSKNPIQFFEFAIDHFFLFGGVTRLELLIFRFLGPPEDPKTQNLF